MLKHDVSSNISNAIIKFIGAPDRTTHKVKTENLMGVILSCLNAGLHPVYVIEWFLVEAIIDKDEETLEGLTAFYWKLHNFLTRSSISQEDMLKLLKDKYITCASPHQGDKMLNGHINIEVSNKTYLIDAPVWRDLFAGMRRNGKTVNLYASQSEWFNDLIESRHMDSVVKVLHYGQTGFEVGFEADDINYPTVNLIAYLMLDALHSFMTSSSRDDVINLKASKLLSADLVDTLKHVVDSEDVDTWEAIKTYSPIHGGSNYVLYIEDIKGLHAINMFIDVKQWYAELQALKEAQY